MIICGKYGNNRPRTESVTERTRFSKSRSNDLEDIGQGQRSLHATHLLVLNPIFSKKVQGQKHPGRWGIVEHQLPHAIDHFNQIWKESILNCRCYRADTGRTDGQTDGRTDRRTEWNQYTPPTTPYNDLRIVTWVTSDIRVPTTRLVHQTCFTIIFPLADSSPNTAN